MSKDGRRRNALRAGLLGLSTRATRPIERQVQQFVLGLVPGEDGIAIPGICGFIGCYLRQLVRGRRAVAVIRTGSVGTAHPNRAAIPARQRGNRERALRVRAGR